MASQIICLRGPYLSLIQWGKQWSSYKNVRCVNPGWMRMAKEYSFVKHVATGPEKEQQDWTLLWWLCEVGKMGLLKSKEKKNKICFRCREMLKRQIMGMNVFYYCRSCGYLVSSDFVWLEKVPVKQGPVCLLIIFHFIVFFPQAFVYRHAMCIIWLIDTKKVVRFCSVNCFIWYGPFYRNQVGQRPILYDVINWQVCFPADYWKVIQYGNGRPCDLYHIYWLAC